MVIMCPLIFVSSAVAKSSLSEAKHLFLMNVMHHQEFVNCTLINSVFHFHRRRNRKKKMVPNRETGAAPEAGARKESVPVEPPVHAHGTEDLASIIDVTKIEKREVEARIEVAKEAEVGKADIAIAIVARAKNEVITGEVRDHDHVTEANNSEG